MDKRFLLDSNLISELSKPQPNANVLTNIQRFEPLCAISAITLQEALFGVELLPDGSRKNRLKEYVEIVKQKFDVIPYDAIAAVLCRGSRQMQQGWATKTDMRLSNRSNSLGKRFNPCNSEYERFRNYCKNLYSKIGELVRNVNFLL